MNTTLPFPEAPASATFRYVDRETGGEIQLTLRGWDGTELLAKVQAALDHLTEDGATIVPPRTPFPPRSTAAPASAATGSNGAAPLMMANGEPPKCHKHGVGMKPSKWGGWYCGMPDPTMNKGYCPHKVTEKGQYKS